MYLDANRNTFRSKDREKFFYIASKDHFCILRCIMPRETVILECTEARKEGKPPSRYVSSRNKKLQTDPVEKRKYNRFLKRHTMHREIKS